MKQIIPRHIHNHVGDTGFEPVALPTGSRDALNRKLFFGDELPDTCGIFPIFQLLFPGPGILLGLE